MSASANGPLAIPQNVSDGRYRPSRPIPPWEPDEPRLVCASTKHRAIEHAYTDINPAQRELKQSKRRRIEQTEYAILGHNSGLGP